MTSNPSRAFSCCEYTFHCSNGSNDFQCFFSFMSHAFPMNPFFPKHGSNLPVHFISFLKVSVYYYLFSEQHGICNPILAAIACQHTSAHFNGRKNISLASNLVPPVAETSDLRFEIIWPTVPQKIQWINVDHE